MKKLILLPFLLFVLSFHSVAQSCIPDTMWRDSMVGIYPPPVNDMNPDGGITESACIGASYAYTLTIKVPRTLIFNGQELMIDSIVAQTEGAIDGLPSGLSYQCNPPDCVFDPLIDSLGCLLLSGIASADNTPGDYTLLVTVAIWNNSPFNPLTLQFPNSFIMGADGEYTLVLEPEGSTNCLVGVNDLFEEKFVVEHSPNPFSYFTNISVESSIEEELEFGVYDLMGKLIERRSLRIYEGTNRIEFDGSNLPEGVYIYTLGNQDGVLSRKMTISR